MSKINYNGAILYSGPSLLDPSQNVVVIITGLLKASANQKTGAMLQTWIILEDYHPSYAIEHGYDAAICGNCPHRYDYDADGVRIRGSRTCYVRVANAPRAVWQCYRNGGYLTADQWSKAIGRGRKRQVLNFWEWLEHSRPNIRFGSYGDPLAAPVEIWQQLAAVAVNRTGYTHQWRLPHADAYKGLVQASCDSLIDFVEASSHGWNTFRVLPKGAATPAGSVHCQASEEKGHKTTCARCHLCDGTSAHVAIWAHGATAANVKELVA